jgi:hypothetical protein
LRFVFAFLGLLLLGIVAANPAPSRAAVVGGDKGEAFAIPTFRELSQMLVMMGGLDIQNPKVADEYAKLMYCGLYYDKFKNDFEWNKIRQQIVNRVGSKKEYYRIQYQMSGTLYLDRYNFETQDFPLGKQSAMTRVGSMILYDSWGGTTGEDQRVRRLCRDLTFSQIFPGNYTFQLNQPLTVDRLKLPVDEAKELLDRMTHQNNHDRRLYLRIRVRVMGVDRTSGPRERITNVFLKGEVTNVDIFLDYDMTKYLTSVTIK